MTRDRIVMHGDYDLAPSAELLPDNTYGAQLLLSRYRGVDETRTQRFASFGAFPTEREAIDHAIAYGVDMIDGRKGGLDI